MGFQRQRHRNLKQSPLAMAQLGRTGGSVIGQPDAVQRRLCLCDQFGIAHHRTQEPPDRSGPPQRTQHRVLQHCRLHRQRRNLERAPQPRLRPRLRA